MGVATAIIGSATLLTDIKISELEQEAGVISGILSVAVDPDTPENVLEDRKVAEDRLEDLEDEINRDKGSLFFEASNTCLFAYITGKLAGSCKNSNPKDDQNEPEM